jgi:uncharacterized protein YjbJ (UPF0337 family)
VSGKLDEAKGRTKKAAGELKGDQNLKTRGRADQAKGKAKSGVDKVADKAKSGIRKAG